MEKKHLNNNGPHHQTKLFISHDGENQGANIPLGVQGCVKYLKENHYSIKTYALNFILNAIQTKELLKYHYTYPQSTTPERQAYLDAHTQNNHSKNSHIPNYPAFCRNISSSNGDPIYKTSGNLGEDGFLPYPKAEATIYYYKKNWSSTKEILATYSQVNNNIPFYYHKRLTLLNSWQIDYEIVTNQYMLNVDNASGGGIFELANPSLSIFELMESKFGNAKISLDNRQFCFTPILFTHDIKNYNPNDDDNNYRMNYNFFKERLLFQTENQVVKYTLNQISDEQLKHLNDYGYPHLGLPNTHYTVTPFDALFCSNKVNTEHLTFNNIDGTAQNGTGLNESLRGKFKNWIMEEADYYNTFIQNRKYGYNARFDYIYVAHINSTHGIYIGNHVTQRTDFKNVEVRKNAELICKAAEQIVIKPGFYTEMGGVFIAKIEPFICIYNKSSLNNNPYLGSTQNNTKLAPKEDEIVEKDIIELYPNPTNHLFTINTYNNLPLNYKIYTLQGKLLQTGHTTTVTLNQPKGIYIVVVTQNNKTSTHKLIIN